MRAETAAKHSVYKACYGCDLGRICKGKCFKEKHYKAKTRRMLDKLSLKAED